MDDNLLLLPRTPHYISMQDSVSFNIRSASIYLPLVIPVNASAT